MNYPGRAGAHANTAFALILADSCARVVNDRDMRGLTAERAPDWFDLDRPAQVWEPVPPTP